MSNVGLVSRARFFYTRRRTQLKRNWFIKTVIPDHQAKNSQRGTKDDDEKDFVFNALVRLNSVTELKLGVKWVYLDFIFKWFIFTYK